MNKKIFTLLTILSSITYSEPISKLKMQKKLLKGLDDKKKLIERKETIFLSKNKRANPQDINWINKRLDFIYEINILILDELDKVLDFDTDTLEKDNTISLYLNPLAKGSDPKKFSFYQEMNMNNGDDIKFIFYTSNLIIKKNWPLDRNFSKNGLFAIWMTLANNLFFDCKYYDNYIVPILTQLVKNEELSPVGILFISNIENPKQEILDEIEKLILKENNPVWTKNIKYVKTIYKLNHYFLSLKQRKYKELKEEADSYKEIKSE